MIQTLADLAQARIRECAPQAVEDFRRSVRPIYAAEGEDYVHLEHVGSCLLLEIDGRRILSTAAHIADWLTKNWKLCVLGLVGTHPIGIVGRVRATVPPMGIRQWDHLDCAFWEVPGEAVAAFGPVEFLGAPRLSKNRAPVAGRAYTAFGFPVCRNEDSIDAAGSISVRMSMYTGGLVDVPPTLAEKLPMSGQEHLLLNFSEEAETIGGESIATFDPVGLSGGALIDLGDFCDMMVIIASEGVRSEDPPRCRTGREMSGLGSSRTRNFRWFWSMMRRAA